ncbi:hypothetical protein GA0061102_1005141 [Rhizobium miluonense]|uniref:Uncharacterized protein n=1 Tax=Rhizobium miluonense TaxID=411945 RepID=A0A1C3USD6_9HYPH|nr:hypothetical protein GA0061102_1005141 [Rhizobium miluonense]
MRFESQPSSPSIGNTALVQQKALSLTANPFEAGADHPAKAFAHRGLVRLREQGCNLHPATATSTQLGSHVISHAIARKFRVCAATDLSVAAVQASKG